MVSGEGENLLPGPAGSAALDAELSVTTHFLGSNFVVLTACSVAFSESFVGTWQQFQPLTRERTLTKGLLSFGRNLKLW